MALNVNSNTGHILVDVSIASKTIILPRISDRPGRIITVKDSGFASNTNFIRIQVASLSGDTFEKGIVNFFIDTPFTFVSFIADSSSYIWRIVGSSIIQLPPQIQTLDINYLTADEISSFLINVSSISSAVIVSDRISSAYTYANTAYIENLSTNNLLVNNISSLTLNVSSISSSAIVTNTLSSAYTYANTAYIENISSNNLVANDISCLTLNVSSISSSAIVANTISSAYTYANTAYIENLSANDISSLTLNVSSISTSAIVSNTISSAYTYANTAYIENISSNNLVANDISSLTLNVSSISTSAIVSNTISSAYTYANTAYIENISSNNLVANDISSLTLNVSSISTSAIVTKDISINNAYISSATISTLDVFKTFAENIDARFIYTSTLSSGQASFISSVEIQGGLSVFSTIGTYGLAVLSNTTMGGTLDVTGLATLVNSSNTGTLGVAGLTTLESLSTVGQAAFHSSVQIQGGLSVFSTIATSGLNVSDRTTLNTLYSYYNEANSTSTINAYIQNAYIQNLSVSFFTVQVVSTLTTEYISDVTITYANISSANISSLQSGEAVFYSSVHIQGGLSVFSTIGAEAISIDSVAAIGGTLDVTGFTTLANTSNTGYLGVSGAVTMASNLSTIGQAAFYSSVQIQGGLSVFSSIATTNLNFTGALYSNGVLFAGSTGAPIFSTLSTLGQAAFYSSVQIQGGLSVFSTIGTYGLSVLSNTTIGGTLDVTGVTTLSNTSNTGTLGVAGAVTMTSNLSTIGQAAFYSSVQIQGGLSVFSSIATTNLNFTGALYSNGILFAGSTGAPIFSTLSTVGQAAFHSSVQIRGGLSVFSTIGTYGLAVLSNTTVGGTLGVTGLTTLSNQYIRGNLQVVDNFSVNAQPVAFVFAGQVGSGSNFLRYSYNGTTWSNCIGTFAANSSPFGIYFGNGTWLANTELGDVIYSKDGIAWKPSIGMIGFRGGSNSTAALWNGSYWLYVGSTTSAASIRTSLDGITWTQGVTTGFFKGSSSLGNAIAWDGSTNYVAVGELDSSGNSILTTNNPANGWSSVAGGSTTTGGFTKGGISVEYGKDNSGTPIWLAGGSDISGNSMKYSYDRTTWINVTGNTSAWCFSIAYGKDALGVGLWLAGGRVEYTSQYTSMFMYSRNGINWFSTGFTNSPQRATRIVWNPTLSVWLAIGQSPLYYSTNGFTWTSTTFFASESYWALGTNPDLSMPGYTNIYNGNLFTPCATTIASTLTVGNNTTLGGTLQVAGSTTLSTLSTIGQGAFYSSVQMQGGLSVFSTIGAFGLSVANNTTIGGTLNVTGLTSLVNSSNTGTLGVAGSTTLSNLSTLGPAAFYNSVQIQDSLSVFSSIATTNLNFSGGLFSNGIPFPGTSPSVSTMSTLGEAAFYSSVQMQGGLSVFSTIGAFGLSIANNTTVGGELSVTGLTSLVNSSNTGTVGIAGSTTLGSNLSTMGQAAFYSSVQMQGGLSVFSTIGAFGLSIADNTTVGGELSVTGLTSLVNSSNTGTVGIAGSTTLGSNLSTMGQAAFYSSVQMQGGLSVFSTIGAFGLSIANNTTVGGELSVTGLTSLVNSSNTGTVGIAGSTTLGSNLSTMGQAAFYSSVQMQGGLSVFSTIGAFGLSIANNTTVGGELSVTGLTTLVNTSNTGTFGVAGATTLGSLSTMGQAAFYSSVQMQGGLSVFSTIGAFGLSVSSNVTIGGTLQVAGLTTLVNSSNTGTLGIAGVTTLASLSTVGQAAFYSSVQVQGGMSIFSSLTATNINFTGFLTSNGATFSGAPPGINSVGTVGINSASNASYSLFVTGDIVATGNVTAQSDIRKKDNVVTIDSPLDKILNLRGVYYTRNDSENIIRSHINPTKPTRQVGVIAQEVEEVFPEVVMTDTSDDKIKSVAYGNIVALLIEGMKSQQLTIQKSMSNERSLQSTLDAILLKYPL